MAKYIINGGNKLHGTVRIAGNKNAVLPIMAATLLFDEDVTLHNVPEIKDVTVMGTILKELGAVVEKKDKNTLVINAKNVSSHTVPADLSKQLRASVLLLGPLYARFGNAILSHPGGDVIGRRSIDSHLSAFSSMGAEVSVEHEVYTVRKKNDREIPENLFLDEPSVTATENIIMALSGYKKSIVLENCALEPHVDDLISFLTKAGMDIRHGKGSEVTIKGSDRLKGLVHTIGSDYIEEGTFAVLAAATQSSLSIENGSFKDLLSPFHIMKSMGIQLEYNGRQLQINPSELTASPKRVQAGPHPNFPTDLMSPFIVLATQARGEMLFHDPMYESRMFFVDKLTRMGARIIICDPHRVIVMGPTKLTPQYLFSPDIRAGMALVIAALCAKGESVIENAEMIERGYEKLPERLKAIGAEIERKE